LFAQVSPRRSGRGAKRCLICDTVCHSNMFLGACVHIGLILSFSHSLTSQSGGLLLVCLRSHPRENQPTGFFVDILPRVKFSKRYAAGRAGTLCSRNRKQTQTRTTAGRSPGPYKIIPCIVDTVPNETYCHVATIHTRTSRSHDASQKSRADATREACDDLTPESQNCICLRRIYQISDGLTREYKPM